MTKFAFISRHNPSKEQFTLANEQGIELVHIGDLDAFSVSIEDIPEHFEGVIVVHPMMALRLSYYYPIGVFENSIRSSEGDKPQFFASKLVIWRSYSHDYKLERKLYRSNSHD